MCIAHLECICLPPPSSFLVWRYFLTCWMELFYKTKIAMTNPAMMTTTTTVASPSNGIYVVEVNAATAETQESKERPSFAFAMLMYDDMEMVQLEGLKKTGEPHRKVYLG